MIRVIIADDHAVVRKGMRLIAGDQPGIDLCGEAADYGELMHLLRISVCLKPVIRHATDRGTILPKTVLHPSTATSASEASGQTSSPRASAEDRPSRA